MPSNKDKKNSASVKVSNKRQHEETVEQSPSNGRYIPYKLCLVVLILSYIVLLLPSLNTDKSNSVIANCSNDNNDWKPTYLLFGRRLETGYLRHVTAVLQRLGYRQVADNRSDWVLMWAHDYPFRALPELVNLLPYQKVNHFPGSGYITNKVDLAVSDLPHVPKAFRLPADKEKFLQYIKTKPGALFVQKHNQHRGIVIRSVEQIDLNDAESFVQEYIGNPLLVDGYKFDIGVYVVLTSIDPLRVYAYAGDILFRFCPVKYHPFDSTILDKYVVGDDYLPIWEVPSLKKYYKDLGFSMKDSFDAHLRSIGRDPTKIWSQVDEAIRSIYLKKESLLVTASSRFKSTTNFFEMVRIDLIVDDDFNVYLMEANMSPNLSSAHYPPNRLLYEQVLFNIFSLVGIGRMLNIPLEDRNADAVEMEAAREMQVSQKNLAVFPDTCMTCIGCETLDCLLCQHCLTGWTLNVLRQAYIEHKSRRDCRRIFPPPMNQVSINVSENLESLSPENRLMVRWFQGKCLLDKSWCV